jgi:uncharacterized SAM-binding protein YcdF (DUF218 family)
MDLPLILFWTKKLAAMLILPPLGPLLPIAAGLLLLARRPRLGRTLAWSGLLAAVLLSTPASVGVLLRGLEATPPLAAEAARRAQAIVILAAGQRRHAPEFGGATVNRLSLERLRYGARLARRSGLPILVSGGAPAGEIPEALLMKDALERDFGLKVTWTESASRDTRGNARFSAEILRDAGIGRVLLVTHAAHMPRAEAEFRAAGLEVIPAPTGWLGGPGGNEEVMDFVPGATAAYAGWFAAHEWLGRGAYWLTR